MEKTTRKITLNDDIKRQLDLVIGDDRMSAEIALRHLLDEFGFEEEELLKARSMEKGLNISFSNVTYPQIAEAVGLAPGYGFNDVPLFDLHRSRVPTALFRIILADIDSLSIQYGKLKSGRVTEGKHLLAPVFNRLVEEFSGAIQNSPESFMSGRIAKDRIDYHFKTFGRITVVLVEVEPEPEGTRLEVIAQMIEECKACYEDGVRSQMRMPIYGILFCEDIFQFFIFDGSTKPHKFSLGVIPGHLGCRSQFRGLHLFPGSSKSHEYSLILGLRPICETILNFFIVTYVATLKAFRDSCARSGPRETFGTQSLPRWDEAINLAEEALRKSQDAEAQRQDNSIAAADATAETAFKALKHSTNVAPWPNLRGPGVQPLLDSWDNDDELAKV